MDGFFTRKETESISAVGGKIQSCASCGLYRHCQSPKMKPYGKFEKDIMIIGEYPEIQDDQKGKPFQDRGGRLLQQVLRDLGIDLFRDCITLNAVNCYSGKKPPSITEVGHCRAVIVWKAILKYQPKMILVLGDHPITSVIGHRWSGSDNITKWRGFCIPDQELKSWVCPTYSPQYLERIEKPARYMVTWKQDIERALKKVENPFPKSRQPDIRIVKDSRFLSDISPVLSSFDYETTGIKPHKKGHRIVCVSIADREDRAWVFPAPKSKAGWQPFRKWLHDKRIPKMAHNIKFEDTWSKEILKVSVNGWEWDSMLAAHLLDNRSGISGLKFQTYAQLGIQDYSTEVGPYLKSGDNENGANSINRIQELMKTKKGQSKVLEYCALDSIYQYRLAIKQMDELGHTFLPF